jgi:uncharacterized protein (TIGR02246 family)
MGSSPRAAATSSNAQLHSSQYVAEQNLDRAIDATTHRPHDRPRDRQVTGPFDSHEACSTRTLSTMKNLSGLATLALIGLCSCAGSPKQPASQPKAEAQIDEFTTKFLVEWNERDSDGLAGLFTDDGVRVVSGEQLPAAGRDAIARSFAQTMGDPSLTEKVNLNITVAHARDLGNGIVIADGRFEATDPDGTVTLTGKWGNVFRQTDDGLRLLLESAHAEPAADADPDRFANMTVRATPPAGSDRNVGAQQIAALQGLIDLYLEGFNTGDGEMLASAFAPDGAQIIAPVPTANRGRAAIAKSANERLAGDTLSATELRARRISDTLIAHNGLWQTHDADGKLTGFGQWGNLIELQPDGSAKLLVECAGPFHGAD